MPGTEKAVITVFGSHSPAPGDAEYEAALELGRALADEGFAVASGGYGGTMEAVLKGAQQGGAPTYGFTVSIFQAQANRFVQTELRTSGLFERLEKMLELSAGMVVMKGGTGTLVELAVAWELVNKKMVPRKPIVCLGRFWRPVVDTLRAEPSLEDIRSLRPAGHSAADYIRFASAPNEVAGMLALEIGKD